jgi:hypothetical protein
MPLKMTLATCKQARVSLKKKFMAMLGPPAQPTRGREEMPNKGDDSIRTQVQDALRELAAPIHEDLLEINARVSAQRFLLEQMYANLFLKNPDGFTRFMQGALLATQERSTRSGPMSEESALELQARIATHLLRFQASVEKRLREH